MTTWPQGLAVFAQGPVHMNDVSQYTSAARDGDGDGMSHLGVAWNFSRS
jgi:hypothetical protein